MTTARLVLASASPRRVQLLAMAGIIPAAILPADLDESPLKDELPLPYARRIARAKLDAVAAQMGEDCIVLAADTVVACGRRILPKADNPTEVKACLGLLSGRRHIVHTAIAAQRFGGKAHVKAVSTRVSFKRLTKAEIEAYAASGEGVGKAGGYAIQGLAASFIPAINGSYGAVVGLPVAETVALITGLGFSSAPVSCDVGEAI